MCICLTHLAETFRLCMLLEAEGREVHTRPKDLRLGQDTDTSDAIDLHLHVHVTVWISQVGQMWTPCRIFRVSLDDDGILIQCVGQSQRSLGLLPRIEIVRLLATKPVGQGTPHVYIAGQRISAPESAVGRSVKAPGHGEGENSLGTITSLLCRIKSSRMVKGAVSTSASRQYTQL